MTYIEDLKPATYGPFSLLPGTRAVGWLSKSKRHASGEIDAECLRRVRVLYAALYNSDSFGTMSPAVTAGFHDCEFCERTGQRHGENLELYVRDPDGGGYEAPAMLLHYIEEHSYSPPDAFVRAVLSADSAEALIAEQQRASAQVIRVHQALVAEREREHPRP